MTGIKQSPRKSNKEFKLIITSHDLMIQLLLAKGSVQQILGSVNGKYYHSSAMVWCTQLFLTKYLDLTIAISYKGWHRKQSGDPENTQKGPNYSSCNFKISSNACILYFITESDVGIIITDYATRNQTWLANLQIDISRNLQPSVLSLWKCNGLTIFIKHLMPLKDQVTTFNLKLTRTTHHFLIGTTLFVSLMSHKARKHLVTELSLCVKSQSNLDLRLSTITFG